MTTIPPHRLRQGPRELHASGSITRRELLGAGAASLALAGLGGCQRATPREIVPFDDPPPEMVPGLPLHYATALVLDGYATGVLVQSREGRPIKIEGSPEHPASLGATTAWQQAALYDLYDPQRLDGPREGGTPPSWEALAARLRAREDAGAGLRLWLEPTSSPLRAELLGRVLARFPEARVTFSSSTGSEAAFEATAAWAGRTLAPHFDLAAARRIVALDADPLGRGPMCLRHARQFAEGRWRTGAPSEATMSRLYVAEPVPTCTGAVADVRLPVPGGRVAVVAALLLREVLVLLGRPTPAALDDLRVPEDVGPALHDFVATAAADLVAYAGRSLVLAGEDQPPEVHVIAHVLNDRLGNLGHTAWFTEPALIHGQVQPRPDARTAELPLPELVEQLQRGEVDTLVIASGDVAHTHSALGVPQALRAVPHTVYWGRHLDATARRCRWVVPAAHDLESWGDARAYDGTVTTLQPLLEPLDGGRTVDELLALLSEPAPMSARALLRRRWVRALGSEEELRALLQRGLLPDSALPPVELAPDPRAEPAAFEAVARRAQAERGLELALRVDGRLHDGRFASNAWLQELPDPVTKLTWGNALLVSPSLAERHGLRDGQIARLSVEEGMVEGPVIPVPGHADEVVSIGLGYGRDLGRDDEPPRGMNAYPLLTVPGERYRGGATLQATSRHDERLARTQEHFRQHDRELARLATLAELVEHGEALTASQRGPTRHLMLGNPMQTADPQWGMAIDLSLCTGCSACVVACQAENNIPVVGPSGVARGREMHWLRIDRYYEGPDDRPRVVLQPMLCQHCEHAPCEYVCPTAATVHSPDGLNEMIYNRCVGTRFCSNNCPYSVRRFNWFDYGIEDRRALAYSPDVTVRERGVMEKCTYCVQRIRRAHITARVQGRPEGVEPGQPWSWTDRVVTACQQACPTGSILFGDLSQEGSAVVQRLQRPHNYQVLHDLGTQPRTQYLVKIVNLPSYES